MSTIGVDFRLPHAVWQRLQLLARAWGISEAEAIERLLDHFQSGPGTTVHTGSDQVEVHVVYRGTRVEGFFHKPSHRLDVTSGPLAGRSYRSPSGAAIAVVSSLDRTISPNRNGWSFWLVTSTGERLESIRESP